ncbi:hypothetical protein Peur_048076 [Populus x canadensis]
MFFLIKCGFELEVQVLTILLGFFFFFFFFFYNRGSSILFDQVEQKYDVVLWSAMASSFVENGKYKDDCLSQMYDMFIVYAKCGELEGWIWVFRGAWKKDLISWKTVDSWLC